MKVVLQNVDVIHPEEKINLKGVSVSSLMVFISKME
jgi:hypothetical protein